VTRLAIMQPYFFPYLGYFQLISAVDRFVFYDDVNFIRGGWINRNRINLDNKPAYITVQVSRRQPRWREKILGTLTGAYARAPYFAEVFTLARSVLTNEAPSIAAVAEASIRAVLNYLDLPIEIVTSSRVYENGNLRGPERVLDICRREGAAIYVNAPGGAALYDAGQFEEAGVSLRFLKVDISPYNQGRNGNFIPGLSVIDVLMHNSVDQARKLVMAGGTEAPP
jgi:hypothetical protein